MQVANLYPYFVMPFLVDTKMCCLHFINTLPVKHFNKIHCITSISLWQYHGKGNKYCLHIVLWNHIDDTYLSYQHFTQWKWWIKNTFCYRICLNFVNGKREFSIQWMQCSYEGVDGQCSRHLKFNKPSVLYQSIKLLEGAWVAFVPKKSDFL